MVESLDERVTPAVTATFSAAAGQLKIIGDAQDNTFVVSRDAAGTILVNSGAIPIQGDPGATVANVHSIMMNGVGGNDNLSLDESNGPLPMASIFGGDGNDVLSGGSGMDFVDGGAGNDMVFLGAGDDTFQWNPGDGSDVVEGQGGIDTMVFNGSDLAENFDIAANGSALPFHRVLFTRDVGNIAMDLSGVETIDLNAFGGADTITVNDQSTTEIFSLNLDLSSSGGAGDGQADAVIINGTEGDDFGQIESFGTRISANVSFFPFVRITGAEGANDRLTVNALGGNDEVDATFLSANAIGLVLNGDTGNDELVAGGANDLVIGGPGNDTAFLGAGDDTFVWNPGDGSDVLEGELGNDKLTFNGADTAEDIAIARNGSRVELSRDQGNVLMDINGFEGIDLNALGGADTVTVNNLSGTGVVKVQLNLSGSAASIDGQADNIIINATSDDDDIRLSAAGNTVLVDGVFPVVRITGAEAVNDRLTINGLGGNDSVDDSNFPANLIGLTVLLGQSAVEP